MTTKKGIVLLISAAILLVLSGVVTYSITKYVISGSSSNTAQNSPVPSASVKTVDAVSYCPLNGKKFTTQEQIEWEKRRPVAVMIENHTEARPQSGLSSADIVYEAVAEGGITRFMAVFLCEHTPEIVGPVRSARTYFLDWLSEYDALYAHVGGANTDGPADALAQIQQYGLKDMDQMGAGLEGGYYRDENRNPNVALEHTMYLNLDKLREYAMKKFKWGVEINGARWDSTFEKYKFTDMPGTVNPEASEAATISYEFWGDFRDFAVTWKYDQATGEYLRSEGGTAHIDKNTGKQITTKNLAVLFMEEARADDGYHDNVHLLYKDTGTGSGYLIRDGHSEAITWSKSGRTARTKLYDSNKQEIQFDRGRIWISVVPTFSKDRLKISK